MCWTCYANNLKAYKAEEDINVYKVVKHFKDQAYEFLKAQLIALMF